MPAIFRRTSSSDTSASSSDSRSVVNTVGGDMSKQSRVMSGKAKAMSDVTQFSVSGLTKLDAFIPMDDLPELLVVYDKTNLTNRCSSSRPRALVYKRAYPKPPVDPTRKQNPKGAKLYLDPANTISNGRRSTVLRAPLSATLSAKDESRQSFAVIAKLANEDCRSHHLLRQEAKAYSAFPREFYVDSKPVPKSVPYRCPRAAMVSRGTFPGWGIAMRPKSPMPVETDPPIVPNFYGFYVPVDTSGKSLARSHSSCNDYANSDCHVPEWPKSILLVEDCGAAVEPARMSFAQREECCELVERMHRQGFSHGAPYTRNILVQAGPLSIPRELRSMDTPSFRLVSYGRWRGLSYPVPLETLEGAKRAFDKGKEADLFIMVTQMRLGLSTSSEDNSDDTYSVGVDLDELELY